MALPPPTGPEDGCTELVDFMGTKYPFKVAVPPPGRFDPAKARADTAALVSGSLTPMLEPGTQAATVSTRALEELALGIRPDQVLKGWQAGLPERGAPPAKPGTAAGLAERMDACMTPLLEGVRAELTRQVAAQRGHEDKLAAVAWLNQGARLAARAPGGLAEATASKLGQALGDPGMGKIFLDKVAYYRVLGDLERDAGRELSEDPRLAGVAPEILEDLEADRRRLAREQGLSRQVATARGRAFFSQGLAGAFTAATRGEAGPAYAREQFLELYGAREGESRWQAYQASQAKAPAYALVRGRSQEEIAAAKAGYGGDWALLDQVEAEDAAERRRAPAGNGLTWAPGARAAYDQAGDPGEQAAILWEAQGQAGIPEGERSPWSGEQTTALAEGWLAIPDGPGAAKARIDLLRQDLLSLPAELRAAGQATLERMLSGGTAAGPLGSIVAALEDNRLGDAYAAAATTQPTTKDTPGLVQLADSGQIASDAEVGDDANGGTGYQGDGTKSGSDSQHGIPSEAIAEDPELPTWLAGNRRQAGEDEVEWSRRVGKAFDEATTPLRRLALYEQILEEIGIPRQGLVWPVHGEDDAEALMRVQGLQDDAWLRARPAPEEAQRAWEAYPPDEQWERLWGGSSENLLYFVGPDGRLYEKDAALNSDSLIFGLLKEAETRLAADQWSTAATGDVLAYITGQPDFIIGIASAGAISARRRGRGARLGGLRDPQQLFTSDADYRTYRAINQSGVPLGFASKAELQSVAANGQQAMTTGYVVDGRLAMRGSSVTGRKYNAKTGRYDGPAFDKGAEPSDFDYAIVSSKLYSEVLFARPSLGPTGGRTVRLNADDLETLGQPALAMWLRGQGRKTSIMVYQSDSALMARGPFLWLDP